MDKKTKKNMKRIQKEIERLKKEMRKVEVRPFHSDSELRQKDEDLKVMKREIYDLEKEANQLAVYISGLGPKA